MPRDSTPFRAWRRAGLEYPFGMDPETRSFYLGVDLGGTKIAVSLWAEDAARHVTKVHAERWETLGGGPSPNIERICAAAARLTSMREAPGGRSRGKTRIESIGISGGGPLDPQAGVILSVPNLPGWVDVPIVSLLSERLGAPARLENDANACAVAEWLHGAGRGASHLAFLTCSTGMGAGLILDRKLYRGARFLAGEAGHQVIVPEGLPCGCGKRGCLEAYASGAGIARRLTPLREREPSLPGTARDVVDRAKAGDPFSLSFLRETAGYLAMGLANLIFTLNLERIVLGTIAAAAGPLLLDPLRESLAERLWPSLHEGLEVVPSALWPDLGDHAALSVARDLPGALRGA
ncbi:MAG TPA: ROK family protein [Planctomycetota bacterium]|nr:ROK family protein [Planctomycetota bacterium]